MKIYSARKVALCCAATAVLTIVALAVFRVPLCPRVGHEPDLVGGAPRAKPPKPPDPPTPQTPKTVREKYGQMVARRNAILSVEKQTEFMRTVFRLDIHKNMYWLGIPVVKTPADMWMMQQIITEVRPDYIVEAGTYCGGSALYFAHVLDGLALADAKVITIDIVDKTQAVSKLPLWRKRVEFLLGSSTDEAIVSKIRRQVRGKKVIVVLDSNHTKGHVLNELEAYAHLVSPGSYLIVEDTSIDAIPLRPDFGPGPMAALLEFLDSPAGASFSPDPTRETFLLTFHPGGWLKRSPQ